MRTSIDSRQFNKDLNNIVKYSIGFLDGAQRGKNILLDNLGKDVIEKLKEFIDSNARVNPSALHHVYEWHETGSPNARLFDINYTVSGVGLSLKSTFSQSVSVKQGSKVPFYDKAKVMEAGVTMTIAPRNSDVLVFNDGGEEVFTKKPVTVTSPGGDNVKGSYERVFDSFFEKYFTQAFLRISGIAEAISKPSIYKKNFNAGRISGRAKGLEVGYRWIANMKVGI